MKRIRQFLIGMVLCAVFLSGCTSSPLDPYKLLQEARQAAEEGDWQQALQKYDRLVELSPDNGEVYNGRGAILLEQGKYELALEDLEKAVEQSRDNAIYWYNLGLVRYCLNQYEESIEALSQAISLNVEYADAYGQRSAAYACLGQYEQAEADLEQAETLEPGSNTVYLALLGNAYLTVGELERARNALDQAIAIEAENPQFYLQRAQICILAGDYDQAQEDCVQAIGMQDGFLAGYALLGDLYYAQSEYEQAIANYSVALLEQEDYAGYLNRGSCYMALGQYEEAEADFTQAILLEPGLAAAYTLRGETRENLGDPEGALEDYKTAKDLLQEGEEESGTA